MDMLTAKDIIENVSFVDLLRHLLHQRLIISELRAHGRSAGQNCIRVNNEVLSDTYHRLCSRFKARPYAVERGSNLPVEQRIKQIYGLSTVVTDEKNINYALLVI